MRGTEIIENIWLEDNPDLCLHLMDGNIPLQDFQETLIEILDIEEATVRLHLPQVAMVSHFRLRDF